MYHLRVSYDLPTHKLGSFDCKPGRCKLVELDKLHAYGKIEILEVGLVSLEKLSGTIFKATLKEKRSISIIKVGNRVEDSSRVD